jgi:hypothetical protein
MACALVDAGLHDVVQPGQACCGELSTWHRTQRASSPTISAGWPPCRSRLGPEGILPKATPYHHSSKEIHRHACCGETVDASTPRSARPLILMARHERQLSLASWVDRPRWVAAVAAVASALVAGARIVVAAHGNVATFIIVGSNHVRAHLPSGVPVTSGQGYDGQFYYRMALGPVNFNHTAYGIRMDTLSRFERISYPALSWLVAGGRSWLVPWSLVVVNVIGLACLAALGAVIAKESGRHSWWGLLLPGYFGFVWVLSRDLAEIVTATFVVAGVVALRRNRFVLAATAFSAAVLSRETALLVVAVLALERPLSAIRDRLSAGRAMAAGKRPVAVVSGAEAATTTPVITWIAPGVSFLAWQLVVRLATGSWPLLTSGQRNLDAPFAGLAQGFGHYVDRFPSTAAALWFGELFILVVVIAWAALALRTTTARLYERATWLAYGVLALILAPGIWLGDVGFRSLDDLYVFSCIVLLSSKQRLTVPGVLVAGGWILVAVELIRFV